MSNELWLAQRFLLNERNHYTVTGSCGVERVVVEIDPSVLADQASPFERSLGKLRGKLQSAARQKWESNEALPVFFAHSGRIKHYAITLSAEDLQAAPAAG